MQSSHSVISDVQCFLPLEDFVVAPLRDVTPEAVKDAAHDAIKGGRDVKNKTVLNRIANRLGYAKGYDEFCGKKAELDAFKVGLGLKRRVQLIGANSFPMSPRDVADRLFCRALALPHKLFTGCGTEWGPFWEASNRTDRSGSAATKGSESWIREHFGDVAVTANLLSGQLLAMCDDPAKDKPEPVIWIVGVSEDDEEVKAHTRDWLKAASAFRSWICQSDKGWVNICPFNECVIFLSAANGDYDFVVRGQRDEEFNSQEDGYAPFLKPYDIPSSGDRAHYLRWLYFEYGGFLAKDSYDAEVQHHRHRWDGPIYMNGVDEALRRFLTVKDVFTVAAATTKQGCVLEKQGFHRAKVCGEELWISDLVTVGGFRQFMEECAEYDEYRSKQKEVDRWEPTNCKDEMDMPASATWYDAHAYAAWLGRRMQLGFRLLTADEYISLAETAHKPLEGKEAAKAVFPHPDLPTPFGWTTNKGHPVDIRKIPRGQRWECFLRYSGSERMVSAESRDSAVRFLVSPRFGEWLGGAVGAAVNTATLKSLLLADKLPMQEYLDYSPTSNGMKHSIKIGFRLCIPAAGV